MPITAPVTLLGQSLVGYIDDYQWTGQPNCTPQGSVSLDRVYAVTIPPNQRLRATVLATLFDPSLQITDMCLPGMIPVTGQSCLAGVNSFPAGQPEVLTFLNASSSPRTVNLVIDTSDPTPTTFDLTIEFLPSFPGDVCSTAPTLPVGSSPNQNLSQFAHDYANGAGCATALGPDRVYAVTIPAGNRLTATATTVTPADGGVAEYSPSLSLITSATCSPTSSCVASSAGVSGSSTFFYDNVSTSPLSAFLVVDTPSPTVTANFDLTTSIAPSVLLPGDVCTNTGPAITTSTMLTGQAFTGYGNNYNLGNEGTGCFFADGPDRVYEVTVPAGFRLRAISNASFGHGVNIVAGPASNCTLPSVACTAGQELFASGTLTVTHDNVSGAAQSVFVIVDRQAATPTIDTFNLGIDLVLIPPNDTCGTAGAPITTGTTLTAQSLATAGNDYNWFGSRCVSSSSPELVYAVTVGVGQRLSVSVTSAGFNPILNVVDGTVACNSVTACLAGSNAQTGTTETVTWDNPNPTPRTVFVAVESATASPTAFDITFGLGASPPPPYTKTSITAACQTLTVAATALAAVGDDVESPWAALPFSLSWFGMPMTTYSVSSNGYVGFSTLTAGAVARQFSNGAIPDPAAPNGIAAPLWDDLLNSTVAPTTAVRSETFGTAPNRRFVVEWANIGFYAAGGGGPERLTFQLQVVETTNVVEFHYCAVAANGGDAARASGNSATIGVEDATGNIGLEHSNNVAGSVVAGGGVRFTP